MARRVTFKAAGADVDPTLLRRVLRVVHCLQKERGASCACCTSLRAAEKLTTMLKRARVDSDRALAMMDTEDVPIKITLEKIRTMLDGPGTETQQAPSFRRILVSFTTLISAVLHEFIPRHTTMHGQPRFTRSERDNGKGKALKGLHRVYSHGELRSLSNVRRNRRRQHSEDDLALMQTHSDPTHSAPPPTSPPSTLPRIESKESWMSESTNDEASEHDGSMDQSLRLVGLLDLLDIFVKLKESTGVERAMLTSMLVLPPEDAALMLSDVVLEVESQRRQLEELATLPTGPMRNLVFELITMSEQMRRVQNLVLSGFSLDGLKELFDSDKLWGVMTTYIDKVHSLELLIVEEVECCSPSSQSLGDDAEDVKEIWNSAFGHESQADIQHLVETMPPDEVKRRLLAAMRKEESGVSIQDVADSKKGVDDLLSELRSAPASKEWEIDIYEIRFVKRIGQGSAGTTYIAEWSGLKVAVKVASINEMGLEGWRTEVQALQKLHHPNIIRLLGSVYHPHPLTFCLVLEYCDSGDLADALCKVLPANFFFHVSTSIAKGLQYLHNRGIIHRDIKPSNVLISGDISSGHYQVKVTDFGVATDNDSPREHTAETGTYRYMAPQVVRHETYNKEADVYSYAILVWQLITREEPFTNLSQIEAAAAVSMESKRPPFPHDTPNSLAKLIEECWDDDPGTRPSFEDITVRLEDLQKSALNEDEIRWLEAPLGHPVYKKKKTKLTEQKRPVASLDTDHLSARDLGKDEKKRGGFRQLFSRKSTHF